MKNKENYQLLNPLLDAAFVDRDVELNMFSSRIAVCQQR